VRRWGHRTLGVVSFAFLRFEAFAAIGVTVGDASVFVARVAAVAASVPLLNIVDVALEPAAPAQGAVEAGRLWELGEQSR